MEIQWQNYGNTETDKLIYRMTNSFFSALMWVKQSQDENGSWVDHDYTCMSAAQINVVGSDLLTDNLERAVQFRNSNQFTPGIFTPNTGGGEATLTSTCLGIWGLYSCGQRLSRDGLGKSLSLKSYCIH